MRWSRVCLEAIGTHLPEERIASRALEQELSTVYQALNLAPGQIEALTGVRERRFWPAGTRMSDVATLAAQRALEQAGISPSALGVVVYTGVCRDDLEPATACAVADALGVSAETLVYDLSNACLGVLNGIMDVANRIELGQIQAGLVVSAESARTINQVTLERLARIPTLENLRLSLATFTGGSGAVAVVLTDASQSYSGHRLLGGAALAAPKHHRICRWGAEKGILGESPNIMLTDATAVLTHGIELGRRTWQAFLQTLQWSAADVDRVIGHQVGGPHRKAILEALGLRPDCDYNTYEWLGNTGTVAVPLTLSMADQAGFLAQGDRVALLGIGSGLNCIMLGLHW